MYINDFPFYQYNNFKGSCCRFMISDGCVMFEEISIKQFKTDYSDAMKDESLLS